MALSLESQGRVRQKTREFIKQPGVFRALTEIFQYLSIYKKNSDLQLVVINGDQAGLAAGQILADVACTLYVVHAHKRTVAEGGVDTVSYLNILDDATDDSGLSTDKRLQFSFLAGDAGKDQLWFEPQGLPMATGVFAKAFDEPNGTTDQGTGEAPNGFVIVGA